MEVLLQDHVALAVQLQILRSFSSDGSSDWESGGQVNSSQGGLQRRTKKC
jgi:hypothetical protein